MKLTSRLLELVPHICTSFFIIFLANVIVVLQPYHDQVRNLSRSLLVERLGGLAVSGELNVPALPSLAIVQVFYDKIFLAIVQVLSANFFCQSKSSCHSFRFLTSNPTTFLVAQGLAERSGLKGEVLARAAPSSTSQVGRVQHNNNNKSGGIQNNNNQSDGAQNNNKPPGSHTDNNKQCYSTTTNVTTYKYHDGVLKYN